MPLTLPSGVPSSRNFTAGSFPVAVTRFVAGNTIRRSFSNKPTNARLSLEYQNIDDSKVAEFIEVYRACRASALPVTLSSDTASGMGDTLPERLMAPSGVYWYWASPPVADSVFPNVSNLSIELETDY